MCIRDREALINTLKMEPHYGGWMHGRTHGFLDVEGVAIAHDINHLTVLGWDQSQPFMNATFDWPQWPALEVSDQTVINYYQGIVALGDPLSQNLEDLAGGGAVNPEPTPAPVVESEPVAAEPEPIEVIEAVESAPVVDVPDPVIEEPVMDHGSMDHAEMDHSGMEHGMAHDLSLIHISAPTRRYARGVGGVGV